MKKKLVFGASAICLSLAFWACGDGAIESLEAEDDIARAFALDDEGMKELVKAAEKDCEADESCKAAQNDAYKSPDSDDDEDEESSDSDSGDSSASSSGSTAVSSSNVVVSSSGMVLSSSGAVVTSSAGATSSAGGTSSAQVTPVSSSSGPQITPASSSATVSSSSSVVSSTVDGTCKATKTTVEKGGSTTWEFSKNSGLSKEATLSWTFEGANPASATGTSAAMSKTSTTEAVTYATPGTYKATLVINDGTENKITKDCGSVEVTGASVSGCTCTSDAVEGDVAGGESPVSITWTVENCVNSDGSTEFSYKWDNESTKSTFSATFEERTKKYAPVVTITNSDGKSMTPKCTEVNIDDSVNPEYVIRTGGGAGKITVPSGACVTLEGDALDKDVIRIVHAWQSGSCSYVVTAGSSVSKSGTVSNCGLYGTETVYVSDVKKNNNQFCITFSDVENGLVEAQAGW